MGRGGKEGGEGRREGGTETGRMFSNPLPEYQFRRTEIRMSKNACTPMLTAAAFTISVIQKQAKEPH